MKNFCRAPWLGISLRNNNSLSVCANSSFSVSSEEKVRLSEALNSPQMAEYRALHLKEFPPASCQVCTSRSELGLRTLKDYHNELSEKVWSPVADQLDLRQVAHLDMNLSNVCNLKCRMCSSLRSSSWRDDQNELSQTLEFVPQAAAREESNIEIDFENFKNLRIFVLKGGEPLFDKVSLALIKRFVDTGRSSEINLTIYTNGIFVKEHIGLLSQFKKLNLNLSFEGTGELYSYIRGGQYKFAHFYENILAVSQFRNISTSFMYTPQAYNIFDWVDAVDFVWNKVSPQLINPLSEQSLATAFGNILESPSYLAVSALPQGVRNQALQKIENSKLLHLPVWPALINLLKGPELPEQYQKFLRFTKKLDLIRNDSLLVASPELARTEIASAYAKTV